MPILVAIFYLLLLLGFLSFFIYLFIYFFFLSQYLFSFFFLSFFVSLNPHLFFLVNFILNSYPKSTATPTFHLFLSPFCITLSSSVSFQLLFPTHAHTRVCVCVCVCVCVHPEQPNTSLSTYGTIFSIHPH